jgi:hypothetical protein
VIENPRLLVRIRRPGLQRSGDEVLETNESNPGASFFSERLYANDPDVEMNESYKARGEKTLAGKGNADA